MNNISEQLLQAMDTVIDGKISKLKFDKTIKAKITNIVDLETGEYKVKYMGNIFSAYASNTDKVYKTNEDVYVKVPEGDFSNKKFIDSKVSNSSLSDIALNSLQKNVVIVSPPIREIYQGLLDDTIGVIAGAGKNTSLSGQSEAILQTYGEPNSLFEKYSQLYKTVRIKASFKTAFNSRHNIGNYGVEVIFYAGDVEARAAAINALGPSPTQEQIDEIDKNYTVSCTLDIESMNGDPYNFVVYSPQEVFFDVQEGFLKGIKQIRLFEEEFDYDRYVINGEQVSGEAGLNKTVKNIFAQDIEIDWVEMKDLTEDPLYLDILTQKGTILSDTVTSIDLVGRLLSNGENIMSSTNCECQWYVEDQSVYTGQENYSKVAGFGWKAIDGDFNKLTLDATNVEFKNKYKLVVIYNERYTRSAEVEVVNSNSIYNCGLEQVTEDNNIVLKIENFSSNEVLVGDWYLSYPDGTYAKLEELKNSIVINDYLKYSSITFYCQVKKDDQIITNLQHTIFASDSEEDITIDFESDYEIYRYDANGDIKFTDYEKTRWLSAKPVWKSDKAAAATIQFFGPGPNNSLIELVNFTDAQKTANNQNNQSMMENITLDGFGIIRYNIKKKYRPTYNNNTFLIRITTIDGKVYEFTKEILFLKDGDQGTNGSSYTVVIRPCDNNDNKISGFSPMIYKNGWQGSKNYRCYIYRDETWINQPGNTRYKFNRYKWNDSKNLTLHAKGADPAIQVVTPLGGPDEEHYIRMSVQVVDTKATDEDKTFESSTMLYAFFPIDIAIGNIDVSKVNIDTIPSYIKYSSSGRNPEYDNDPFEFIYDGNDYTKQVESKTLDLLTIRENNDARYLRPATTFIGNNNYTDMGLVKCPIDANNYIMHPVIMYLDTFGNEAINGWDGSKLVIDEDKGQYIFAPQVGAGEKNEFNQFTGLIMAKGQYGPYTGNRWGLYGFQNGVNSFGLDENGRAWFGQTNRGQIKIDGTNATITGGDGGTGTGMTLKMNSQGNGSVKGIELGSGKFWVKYDGSMHSTSGTIGGWHITSDTLYNDKVTLHSDGSIEAVDVSIQGSIEADEGHIGGWHIVDGVLQNVQQNLGNDLANWPIGVIQLNPKNTQAGIKMKGQYGSLELSMDGRIEGDNAWLKSIGTETILITTKNDKNLTEFTGMIGNVTSANNPGDKGIGINSLNNVLKLMANNNISIETTSGSIYLKATKDIQLNTTGILALGNSSTQEVQIKGQKLVCTVPATQQTGIYARFA